MEAAQFLAPTHRYSDVSVRSVLCGEWTEDAAHQRAALSWRQNLKGEATR